MEILVFAGTVILLVLVFDSRSTIASLRRRIEALENHARKVAGEAHQTEAAEPLKQTDIQQEPATPVRRAAKIATKPDRVAEPAPEPSRRVYKPTSPAAPSPTPTSTEPPSPPSPPRPSAAKRFEDLIGGKLPIWIGGIALIFAGFFLVRFSIEAGLFGPAARCATAALFGLLLIGLSEFGYKIPKFGKIFTDDVRIGHSIAGAGIAVLYATLYMASELYGLLSLYGALGGVIAVTILAFVLSQRHGPPTAIMGLLGGFAAPYVAGLGPESVAPLLIYLGVFTAGLFGLAIHRGWAWLALLATGGSVLWTTALLFMDLSGDVPFVGAFIVLLAIGGVLTLSRTGTSFGIPKPVMQAIPLAVGLLQLVTLAPLIQFSLVSWLFFGVLAIFAIALAWRDKDLTPAMAGAFALSLAMIATAFSNTGADQTQLFAAISLAVLFGAAGHFFALREKDGWIWAVIGLAAPTSILLLIYALGDLSWSQNSWAISCLLTAITTAFMAWRTRAETGFLPPPLASGLTAILIAIALWIWTPESLGALVAIAVAAGLAFWARFIARKAVIIQSAVAIGFGGLIMLVDSFGLIESLFSSLAGQTDLYSYLPELGPSIVELLLPAIAIAGIAFFFRDPFGKILSKIIAGFGLIGAGGFAYMLLKQPLAIGPIEDFVAYGFAERAVFTHALALGGWLLLRRTWDEKFAIPLKSLGFALAGLALFRFVYFDLLLLSPTSVKQAMGPAPVANLGTLHFTAAMLWLWLYARTETVTAALPTLVKPLEIGSLFAAIAAVMVTVRQAVHGTDIATPPFTSTETYLYSAGLLVLAIAWLARGIQTTNALLRIAGLLLMIVVTFKVFVIDAAQLEGLLRILSFLGLAIALIGIGWIYGKVMRADAAKAAD
ncbi:DUF2339 domain-containing protein [Parasphingorhabdus cellanae]|uniref:DUF2339 domain-containing protein n=1 Tax=Parasphingorhabdus cellanae TaxID=2806553 RepID=A0ABX7T8D8_9SPHN|nr:DUF2339 domain-containing protein [Parasphingorhabdus cellanae]QTD57168.1 DUF2339 domain-containing protein [Parasphingorhabdus cellanae]